MNRLRSPDDDPAPNVRGPSLLSTLGAAIGGCFLAGMPLACVETTLEHWGRRVGPAYQGLYFPVGVFGAWLGVRFLKRRR